jgi:hypothetical protein
MYFKFNDEVHDYQTFVRKNIEKTENFISRTTLMIYIFSYLIFLLLN